MMLFYYCFLFTTITFGQTTPKLNINMIQHISFEEILPIWRDYLWPNRVSAIENTSAMTFLGGYDLKNMQHEPTFFAYTMNNKIVGVNSGHLFYDNSYRSRGLWVFPEYRGNRIGIQLLLAAIEQGTNENVDYIWSYPKFSSWNTYRAAGFTLASKWHQSELDLNAYCTTTVPGSILPNASNPHLRSAQE